MNDHLFAEGGRNDVCQAGERFEDALGDQTTQRRKEKLVAHERNTAADNDAPWAHQRDHMANGFRERGPRVEKDRRRIEVPVSSGGGDDMRGNRSMPDELEELFSSGCEMLRVPPSELYLVF